MARTEVIERQIVILRGERVILDFTLARWYGVSTGNLNLSVRRNRARFPPDFMFQISSIEAVNLRLQFARSSWGGRRTRPYAFTEHGVSMLSSILKSRAAVQFNIQIMRAFVRFRRLIETDRSLARKVAQLETGQKRHGRQITRVYRAVNELLNPPSRSKRHYGFPTSRLDPPSGPLLLPSPKGNAKKRSDG
jgi:hypothetical protein